MKTLANARDKAELLSRLQRLQPASERRWGTMSPAAAVCHLADAFRLLVGEKTAHDRSTLVRRTLVKWVALYAPLRWPAGIRTTPEFDQRALGTPPGAFEADVAGLAALVERVSGMRTLGGLRHPIFGAMSSRAWLRWGYLHVDHHLRQFGV